MSNGNDGAMAKTLDPLTVSPTEAARLLGVHRSTIYHMAHRGEFRMVKLGPKRTGVVYADLLAMIRNAPKVSPKT